MKRLRLILFTFFTLAWAQDLNLKKNDITVIIAHNQSIEIILKDNDVYKGRFLKVEKNNIIVEGSNYGSFLTIPFNQVKMIILEHPQLDKLKGFGEGAMIWGTFTMALITVASIALEESFEIKDLLNIGNVPVGALVKGLTFSLPAALLGGTINAMRNASKDIKAYYKIDQDNWKIVTG